MSTLASEAVYSATALAIQLVHTIDSSRPRLSSCTRGAGAGSWPLPDNQQRPLFLPDANRPYNAAGILEEVASQQVVGSIQGLPVVTDPNIETNLGTGGNEDAVYVLRASDVVLWESGIRARVLPETRRRTSPCSCSCMATWRSRRPATRRASLRSPARQHRRSEKVAAAR